MTNLCRFARNEADDMAKFCAVLTREGIAFNTYSRGDTWVVEITGY